MNFSGFPAFNFNLTKIEKHFNSLPTFNAKDEYLSIVKDALDLAKRIGFNIAEEFYLELEKKNDALIELMPDYLDRLREECDLIPDAIEQIIFLEKHANYYSQRLEQLKYGTVFNASNKVIIQDSINYCMERKNVIEHEIILRKSILELRQKFGKASYQSEDGQKQPLKQLDAQGLEVATAGRKLAKADEKFSKRNLCRFLKISEGTLRNRLKQNPALINIAAEAYLNELQGQIKRP